MANKKITNPNVRNKTYTENMGLVKPVKSGKKDTTNTPDMKKVKAYYSKKK